MRQPDGVEDCTDGPPQTEEELEEFEKQHAVVYFGLTAFMAHQLLSTLEYDMGIDRPGRENIVRLYQLIATQMHGKDVVVTEKE